MPTRSAALFAAVFRAKINDLESVLERGRRALQLLPQPMYSVVKTTLADDFATAAERLDLLGRADPTEAQTWERVTSTSIFVAVLGEQCLELAQGILVRTQGLDEEACAVADRVLVEVTSSLALPAWNSFCLPGDGDGYSRRTRTIRLGVGTGIGPEAVWSLHVVAHELGHQVAGLITRQSGTTVLHDVNAVLQEAGRVNGVLGKHVAECFADCFATWTLGPAYGLAIAWRGFGPGAADDLEPTDTHPAPADRIVEVVATLRCLDQGDRMADMVIEIARAGPLAESLRAREDLPSEDLGRFSDRLRRILVARLRAGRFSSLNRVQGLAQLLVGPSPITASRSNSYPDFSIVEVLNGAWWARFHHPAESTRISTRAWALVS